MQIVWLNELHVLCIIVQSIYEKNNRSGTNCKRISKLCFSNFTASPLTGKKSPWIYWGLSIFFSLYNLVHFYPLKGDNFFSSVVQICIYKYWHLYLQKQIWFCFIYHTWINLQYDDTHGNMQLPWQQGKFLSNGNAFSPLKFHIFIIFT